MTTLTLSHPFFQATMPLPPSINASYRLRARRAQHESAIAGTPELQQFKQDAALLLSQGEVDWPLLLKLRESNTKRHQTPLAVVLRFYFSTEWRRDVDGPVKAALDAAFRRLELDDVLVIDLHVQKLVDPVDPRCEIEVRCVVKCAVS